MRSYSHLFLQARKTFLFSLSLLSPLLPFSPCAFNRAVLELVDVWVAPVDKRLCNAVVRAPPLVSDAHTHACYITDTIFQ
jgi:hypothetical protein